MMYLFLLWYITALWVIWRLTTDKSEFIAASIAVILGPFIFPVIFVCRVVIAEKEKWQISAWYRDVLPSREYIIDEDGNTP